MDTSINNNSSINEVNIYTEYSTTINSFIIGNAGSGKSVLKKEIETYLESQSPECNIILKEFPGFELTHTQQTEIKKDILNTIEKSFSSYNINNATHHIIYCLNSQRNRIDMEEIKYLTFLYN